MTFEDWVPIIVAFLAGLLSFVPVWWRTRQDRPNSNARTATTLTEGAAELVDKYERLLDRLEKKVSQQEKQINSLSQRVKLLENQLKELGQTPFTDG